MTRSRKIDTGFYSALFLLIFQALLTADAESWFGGGSFDGYGQHQERPAVSCPAVNNQAGATNVQNGSAWLNGMLLSTGVAPTTVYVYFGLTNGLTNKAIWGPPIDLGVRAEGEKITTQVSVEQNKRYYYRFYATNTAGDEGWAAASASFILSIPPVLSVATGAAPVSYTSATLRGELLAGSSADITLYWGANTNAWAGTNNLGTCGQGPFRCILSGLNSGTIYHYRAYGVNAQGHGWSEIAMFTTRVESVVFTGGGFDGYSRSDRQLLVVSPPGAVLWIR